MRGQAERIKLKKALRRKNQGGGSGEVTEGPVGPQGPQGDTGPQGPPGIDGIDTNNPTTQLEEQRPSGTQGGTASTGSWGARYLNTKLYDDIGISFHANTVTVTIASPGVFTWNSHGLTNGSVVVFTTTGALPTGLAVNTPYYLKNVTTNTFEVSATLGGTSINTSGTQSGTHTATSSAFTLAAGQYIVHGGAEFFAVNNGRVRLRNIAGTGTTLALGNNVYASNANGGDGWSQFDEVRFTLASSTLVQLEWRASVSQTTNGLGVTASFGEVEIYSRLRIVKIS